MGVPIQKVKRFSHKGTNSYSKTFGATAALPATLGRIAKYIKDQGPTNYCTAAARSASGSYLWDQEMSFEWQTGKEGQVLGQPIFNGTDPNTADAASEEYGFLPDKDCPLKFSTSGWEIPAEWQEYAVSLDQEGKLYTGFAPYNVYPDYDSIKQALFQGNADGAIVIANGFWFQSWNNPIGGIVPTPGDSPTTRHSYTFIDWKTINGQEYLVAQLSQGTALGDNGLLYISENAVNTAFKNPAFNGLGCTIYRKGATNPIQTEISLYQRLVMLLGEIVGLISV